MQAIISEKVYGNGKAGNKKEAEQLAAKEALKLIGEID
jgi:dsRNA-specific ribonuclease